MQPVSKPGVPVLLSPAPGALVNSLQPVLDWKDSNPAAHHYQVQIATNSGFTALVINENDVADSTFTPPTALTPGKLYYWRVRAFNINGVASGWSAVRTFKTPLAQPVLVLPTEGEFLLTDRPTFEWSPVSGATSYILQVSRVENFSTLLVNTTLNTTEYSMSKDLPQNRDLLWRVRAKTSAVNSPWSVKGTFKTGNPPSVPVLVAPVNGILSKDYTPRFNWNNSTLPSGTMFKHYELQVADNNQFTSRVIETTTAISEFTPLSDLASNTKFYWRVRAVNTDNHTSGWSPVWSFRTALQAPQALTMIPGETNLQRPSFEWEAPTGTGAITGYTIQVSTSANFSTLLENRTVKDPTHVMGRNLPFDRLIYWRVRVNGVNGPSAWAVEQFSITTGLP